MTDQHPITPPPELVEEWIAQVWHEGTPVQVSASDLHLASKAAEWGARYAHQPAPPVEGEVAELVRLLGSMAAEAELADQVHDASVLDRAADLLHRLSPPQPVPVSERLPGAEDCDAEGRYWGLINGCEAWVLGKGSPSTLNITHWLPAHALPIPSVEKSK